MMKHTYLAISSTYPASGYQVLVAGNSRNAVANKALEVIRKQRTSLYETYRVNLRIVSKTVARRDYGIRDWMDAIHNDYEWAQS